MEDYKFLIVFEDIEEDAIIHAIGDMERIILKPAHSSISKVEKIKDRVWELTFITTKRAVRTLCASSMDIDHHYIAFRC